MKAEVTLSILRVVGHPLDHVKANINSVADMCTRNVQNMIQAPHLVWLFMFY